MPQIKHEKLGITAELKDFSQRQYEQYQTMLIAISTDQERIAAAVIKGAIVRAASESGILVGIDTNSIPDMSPASIDWLTKKIHDHIEEITTVPPE